MTVCRRAMSFNAQAAHIEEQRLLVACEAATAVVLLLMFVAVRDLPMVNLPQHAAQLASWLDFAKPECEASQFVLNLRTPYLLAYLIARVLASMLGVIISLKLVVWLAVVGQVLGLHFLCKRLGHDPWLALLGLPLALGYNFLFGFVSYIFALPFLYVCVGFAATYAERQSLVGAAALVAALTAALLSHGIAFAQALLFVIPLLVFGKGSILFRTLPLLLTIIAAVAWLMPGPTMARLGSDLWLPDLRRLLSLPGLLVGSGSDDIVASLYGTFLLLMVGLAMGHPIRNLGRTLPGVLIVIGFCFGPTIYRGYGPLWPRFAVLLVPAALLAFGPTTNVGRIAHVWRRAATLAVVAVWLCTFGFRLSMFNRETISFHDLVDELPNGLRVRPIVFEAEGQAFPELPVFTHLPAYYLVAKGGTQGYSFAMYPSSVIRYRKGIVPKMNSGEEWAPEAFRIDVELHDYDCFIVHSKADRYQSLFGASKGAVQLRAHAGDWWSYCVA